MAQRPHIIQGSYPDGWPVAITVEWDMREARTFWDIVRRQWRKQANYRPLPYLVNVALPCGNRAIWRKWDEIPKHNTPCPCGDPRHWLIKYVHRLPETE